ncbi:MAG: Wzz/FepE/Etk N-terminal domain-containing protein [Patescibacteria group bacterium]
MTLLELTEIVRKYWKILTVVPLVVAVVVVVVTFQIPPRFDAFLNLYITRKVQDPSGEYYTYDGYYGQQAAERYTDTVVGVLKSKDVLRAVLRELEMPRDQDTLQTLEKKVSVEKVAPQLVSVKVTQRWERGENWKAENVVNSLATEVIARMDSLNENGDDAVSVQTLDEEPVVEKQDPLPALNALVAAFLFLGVTFFAVLFKEYLNQIR